MGVLLADEPATASAGDLFASMSVFLFGIGIVTLILSIAALVYGFRSLKAKGSLPADSAINDKGLEALRIIYGFWLIIAAFGLSFAIAVLTLTILKPKPPLGTGDLVAVITAITGVIGTLIAAFFGIQAAGAGRSQALSALASSQGRDSTSNPTFKFAPSYGPHAGNTLVTISGNGLSTASGVNFGTTPGPNFAAQNDGLATVTSPPAPPGTDSVDVMVVFPSTSQTNATVGTFSYYTITKAHGFAGDHVTVTGSGFNGANGVKFGDASGTTFENVSNNELHVDVPTGPAAGNNVDVAVTYPVTSSTNSVVVGNFHYDVVAPPLSDGDGKTLVVSTGQQ